MKNDQLAERIQELEDQIQYHSEAYYSGSPEVSDSQFDAFVDELKRIDPNSPTLALVGAEVESGRKKIRHSKKMGSLGKVNSVEECVEWVRKEKIWDHKGSWIVGMDKMDGLSLRVVYEDGNIEEAATRGNGEEGEDVLANVMAMNSIPNTIPVAGVVELRGEVHMKKSDFDILNANLPEGEEPFSNPRNAAAGSLKHDDPSVCCERNLSFKVFEVVGDHGQETLTDVFEWVSKLIPEVEVVNYELLGVGGMSKFIEEKTKSRPTLNYQIDGLVFSSNSIEVLDEDVLVGGRPKKRFAFKFPAVISSAKIENMIVQTGRTGRVTPVLEIDPTLIDGSVVSRVTLHNYEIFKSWGFRKGCVVEFKKAGDIIPAVVGILKQGEGDLIPFPMECPSCGQNISLIEREDNNGKTRTDAFCVNEYCEARLESRIIHWLKTLEIKGVGVKMIRGLISKGLLKTIEGLYDLGADDYRAVSGGERSSIKAYEAVLGQGPVELWKVMAGLGIHKVGKTISKKLAPEFGTIDGLIHSAGNDIGGAFWSSIREIDGIGEEILTSLWSGLRENQEALKSISEVLDIPESKRVDKSKSFEFCLTGAMPSGRKRGEWSLDIEKAGHVFSASLKKSTDYLVQADISSESSKTKKAAKNGTQVISEEDLRQLLNG